MKRDFVQDQREKAVIGGASDHPMYTDPGLYRQGSCAT